MSSTLQQRVCIKFCVKNGFNGAQTLEMLEKCFGNDTLIDFGIKPKSKGSPLRYLKST